MAGAGRAAPSPRRLCRRRLRTMPDSGMRRGRRGAGDMPWLWAVFTVVASGGAGVAQRHAEGADGDARHGRRHACPLPLRSALRAAVSRHRPDGDRPADTRSQCRDGCLDGDGAITQIAATALLLAVMQQRSFVVTTAYVKTEPVQVAIFGLIFLGDHISLGAGARHPDCHRRRAHRLLAAQQFGRDLLLEAALLGLASGALFAIAAIGYRGGIRALETPELRGGRHRRRWCWGWSSRWSC